MAMYRVELCVVADGCPPWSGDATAVTVEAADDAGAEVAASRAFDTWVQDGEFAPGREVGGLARYRSADTNEQVEFDVGTIYAAV